MNNELQQIIAAVDEAAEPQQLCLATVVDVVGSAYRRPAARMLIREDGSHIGSISGGCLERDLCRAADELTKCGPKLVSFDTRQDVTNFNPRYNLGCSGIIYVLVQRVTGDDDCPAKFLRQVVSSEQSLVVATIYQTDHAELGSVGTRVTLEQMTSGIKSESKRCTAESELNAVWAEVLSTGRPCCCEVSSLRGSTRVLIERIDPAKPLWIFGAGDDARPLAAMANQLGWQVSVMDDRATHLTRQRFPNSRRIHRRWDELDDTLTATPQTVAVLMTHSFSADKVLLRWLLQTNASYVGVLGPKARTGKIMQQLLNDRQLLATEQLPKGEAHSFADSVKRMHSPVGLDIGATEPAEIAIAVLGEIIAIENNRAGGLLTKRQAPIHDPVRHALIDLTAYRDDAKLKTKPDTKPVER